MKQNSRHVKKPKIDTNRSANFQETMSKIFSDLNKTLDVVNLSMGRASSTDSLMESPEKKNLANVFKNNYESGENNKSKKEKDIKLRSKSWFEVTKEINEKMDKRNGNSPDIKNKSKSLIMTDLNEFFVENESLASPNQGSLETKKGHFYDNKNIEKSESPETTKQLEIEPEKNMTNENKYESQSMKPIPTESKRTKIIMKNTVLSEKQEDKKNEKKISLLLKFKSNIRLSGTLPESNALDYIPQSDSESEEKEEKKKLFFHPNKGIISSVAKKLERLISKPLKKNKSIIQNFSKQRYDDDLISKKSDNRFISYQRNRYKKYIVKPNEPQKLTNNYLPSTHRISQRRRSTKHESRSSNNFARKSGKLKRLNSIKTRYKNESSRQNDARLPDDTSRVFVEDLTSKYSPHKSEFMSHQRYSNLNPNMLFASQYSNQIPQEKHNFGSYSRQPNDVKYYSNMNNQINFSNYDFDRRESRFSQMNRNNYQTDFDNRKINIKNRLQFNRVKSKMPNEYYIKNVGTIEDYLTSLFQILMAFRSKINDLKMKIFLRNNFFDIRLFMTALLRKQTAGGVFDFNTFSEFLGNLNLNTSQSQCLSLMFFIARHHSSTKRYRGAGAILESQQIFNFFRLNLYPREISQSYSLDVHPEEFNLVREIFLFTLQMIKDVGIIVKMLKTYKLDDVYKCLVKNKFQISGEFSSSLYQSIVMNEGSHQNRFLKNQNRRSTRPKQTSIDSTFSGIDMSPRNQLIRSHLLSDFRESQLLPKDFQRGSKVQFGSNLIPEDALLRRFMKSYLFTPAHVHTKTSISNGSSIVYTDKIVDQKVIEIFLELQEVAFNRFEIKYIFKEIAGDINSFDFRLFSKYLKEEFLII